MKRILTYVGALVVLVVLGVTVMACGAQDDYNDKRGRGDAPVGAVNDDEREVINMPDQFSNVAHGCDGHGHRVFVTTNTETNREMAVIEDSECGVGSVQTREPTVGEFDVDSESSE